MLRTIEAEVNADGSIRLLEPITVSKPSRALVVLLDGESGSLRPRGKAADVLKFLKENRLPEGARPRIEEIEAEIAEARKSWD